MGPSEPRCGPRLLFRLLARLGDSCSWQLQNPRLPATVSFLAALPPKLPGPDKTDAVPPPIHRMKKKAATKRTAVAKAKPGDLALLITEVRNLIQSARRGVASVIDTFQVMTNFEIGRRIVEHEQKGAKRAAYGTELLKELSARLTEEFGRGFSPVNLSHMRRFFRTWKLRVEIFQQPAEKSFIAETGQQATDQLLALPIGQQPVGKFEHTAIFQQPVEKSQKPFTLTLPKDANVHASESNLYLPSKELLKTKLLEWTREQELRA